jgi:hypothetical protein
MDSTLEAYRDLAERTVREAIKNDHLSGRSQRWHDVMLKRVAYYILHDGDMRGAPELPPR